MEPLAIELAVRQGTHQPEYVDDFRRIIRQSLSD
jgi:hypothetical protein